MSYLPENLSKSDLPTIKCAFNLNGCEIIAGHLNIINLNLQKKQPSTILSLMF